MTRESLEFGRPQVDKRRRKPVSKKNIGGAFTAADRAVDRNAVESRIQAALLEGAQQWINTTGSNIAADAGMNVTEGSHNMELDAVEARLDAALKTVVGKAVDSDELATRGLRAIRIIGSRLQLVPEFVPGYYDFFIDRFPAAWANISPATLAKLKEKKNQPKLPVF